MSGSPASCFDNVPDRDYLSLFEGNEVRPSKIVKVMSFKKDDVVKATGMTKNSVRYDERIPAELKRRMTEWATLLNLVAQFFGGDINKTTMWFVTPNPILGNISPRDMIRFGRYKKLLKFVLDARAEHNW